MIRMLFVAPAHAAVVRAQLPFYIDLMDAALAEVNLPAAATEKLRAYFLDGATFMINQGDFGGMEARRMPGSRSMRGAGRLPGEPATPSDTQQPE